MQSEDSEESSTPPPKDEDERLAESSENSEANNKPASDRAEHQSKKHETKPEWTFKNEDSADDVGSQPDQPLIKPVSWTASEYIAHQKTAAWFIGLGFSIAVVAIIVYVLTQELISPILISVIGITFGVFAAHKPQVLNYDLDSKGLQIGNKFYAYERFKSFSVLEEGAMRSILLTPLQRFMPPITVYYDPDDEDKIMNVIGNYLPYEDRSHDMVDRLMSKIRF